MERCLVPAPRLCSFLGFELPCRAQGVVPHQGVMNEVLKRTNLEVRKMAPLSNLRKTVLQRETVKRSMNLIYSRNRHAFCYRVPSFAPLLFLHSRLIPTRVGEGEPEPFVQTSPPVGYGARTIFTFMQLAQASTIVIFSFFVFFFSSRLPKPFPSHARAERLLQGFVRAM